MNYILNNESSGGNRQNEDFSSSVKKIISDKFGKCKFVSLIDLDYDFFYSHLLPSDNVILVGGDGTINRFINSVNIDSLPCKFFLYPAGNGNDFYRDIVGRGIDKGEVELIPMNEYFTNLPKVIVNGKTYRFINGVGFGIDGRTCAIAEDQKAAGKVKINYAMITFQQIVRKIKKPDATILIDGKEAFFDRVYLASVMKGKYYGGGVKIAPNQDRRYETMTLIVASHKRRIAALLDFPKIFSGKHIKKNNKGLCKAFTVKSVTVTFTKPSDLEIDGEVIRNVTSYSIER